MQNRLVDMYLPVSQAVADGSQLTSSKLPYQVIPNFIPDRSTSPSLGRDDQLAQLPWRPFMLFVGSFNKQKGMDVLLEAYRGMDTPVPLVLIGYELSDFPLSKLDIPANVIILKNLPNHLVMEAWRRSYIGVIPSNWPEPSPTVVMEAMSMGRPVIATRVGGIPDIVLDGETGLLVPPGDPLALRQAMQYLLDHPEVCQQMSLKAIDRVTLFQADNVVSRIEKVYQDLTVKEAGRG
jgi:glycosyltransferase involved in cell wall biosynthesis